MTAATRNFMSIGELLKVLKEEFPDVSISKIRFLEGEGLIEPERTSSGYRKFYAGDLARLRFILRLQRDQFMPLKVIRQRMDHFDPSSVEEPTGNGSTKVPEGVADEEDLETFDVGVQLSFSELISTSGAEEATVRELEEYGLIDSHSTGDGVYYDEDDLVVARIARDFSKFGIEPRHIRMYRNFADRESGLFSQIIAATRAGGDSQREASRAVAELARLSKRLKHVLLKASLREHLRT